MAQSEPLEKLASTGLLKREPPAREEIAGLLRTGAIRLEDARKESNAAESRFDLAYNAAHAFALAALRKASAPTSATWSFKHSLTPSASIRRRGAFSIRCHRERNATEYEGVGSVDEKLLAGLIEAALELLTRVRALAESRGFSA